MKTIFSAMRNKFLSSFALLGVFAIGAFAADLTGKYVAEVPGRQGTQTNTFDLKADGAKVTGSVTTPRGDQKIDDGKIDGDKLTFTTTMKMGDNDMKMTYTGKVSGEAIEFTRAMEGGQGGGRPPATFTAKKQ